MRIVQKFHRERIDVQARDFRHGLAIRRCCAGRDRRDHESLLNFTVVKRRLVFLFSYIELKVIVQEMIKS